MPLHARDQSPEAGSYTEETAPAKDAEGAAANVQDEDAKLQATYVWQRHPAFPARYSGTNSLHAEREPRSYSTTVTGYLAVRAWQGGELYLNPEMSANQALSGLTGLGGLSNGENQRGGGPTPIFYAARAFLRQTWGMGGATEGAESAANQLAGPVDRNRVVLTIGKVSLVDIFDNNAYSHDPRTQFLNWTIMTSGAFDYAADSRGYTWGAAVEYYRGDWAIRVGRFMQPKESNGLPLDTRLFTHYGDQVEFEHAHEISGQPGKLRLLAFRNRARMGGFQDALDAWRAGGSVSVPEVGAVREERTKRGWGISLEQALAGDLGVFLRSSWNDGSSETYAFTEVERSLSGGAVLKGSSWGRPEDAVGLAYVQNGLSTVHREYLANGGLGFFIGDGAVLYRPEQILEAYYSLGLSRHAWLSLDCQRVANPAYNADRGPVTIVGARVHVEF